MLRLSEFFFTNDQAILEALQAVAPFPSHVRHCLIVGPEHRCTPRTATSSTLRSSTSPQVLYVQGLLPVDLHPEHRLPVYAAGRLRPYSTMPSALRGAAKLSILCAKGQSLNSSRPCSQMVYPALTLHSPEYTSGGGNSACVLPHVKAVRRMQSEK